MRKSVFGEKAQVAGCASAGSLILFPAVDVALVDQLRWWHHGFVGLLTLVVAGCAHKFRQSDIIIDIGSNPSTDE